ALAMGAQDWTALDAEIARHRTRVSAHFASIILGPVSPEAGDPELRALGALLESRLDANQRLGLLRAAGLRDAAAVLARLDVLRESTYYRRLDETGRRRLHALLPRLLQAIAGDAGEAVALGRVL